jgi:solute carrier family 25 (adenine nucleotide translocator) protein 4/5/6/31
MATEQKKKVVRLSFAEDFGLSGVAAVTSKTIAAPIERIKMVVQNQDEMIRRGTLERPFKGIVDCAAWINKNEGFLAFWKSNFTNCIRYFPTQALNFSFKGQVKRIEWFQVDRKKDSYALQLTKNIIGGGLAGGGSLTFVYSLDYARTRLANDMKSAKKGGEREFSGLLDVYKKTWASDGFVGLYRGFNISFVGIFVYRGFYFGLYDTVTPFLPKESGVATRFVIGYIVTVLAGLASYPIDTIRRRMMMTSGNKELQYSSSFACAAAIIKKEGWRSYFKGAGANILRGIAGAGVLAGFDEVTQIYTRLVYGPDCVPAGLSMAGG